MTPVARMLIISAVLLSPGLVLALDGTTWRSLDQDVRAVYVWGVVETRGHIRVAYELEQKESARQMTSTEKHFVDLEQCITKRHMKWAQVVAIVEKYMNDHPDQWNYQMSSIIWSAMDEACKK